MLDGAKGSIYPSKASDGGKGVSQAPKVSEENELVVFFDTNHPMPAGVVGQFLSELEEFVSENGFLQADDFLELLEVQTGTLWVRVRLILYDVAALATIGGLGFVVADHLRAEEGKLAQCASKITVEHGVRSISVIDCKGGTEILRETMPIVRELEKAAEDREMLRYVQTIEGGTHHSHSRANARGGGTNWSVRIREHPEVHRIPVLDPDGILLHAPPSPPAVELRLDGEFYYDKDKKPLAFHVLKISGT